MLSPEARARFGSIAERPYRHQSDACRRILEGKPTVVATGTGSGKTEAFLMPIIDHCFREHREGEDSVKAILIYPMNALANDQCGRIRKLARRHDRLVRTLHRRDPSSWAPAPPTLPRMSGCSATEFRTKPPDLLLTNYLMLEYMLMRKDGREIFKNHRVRYIVLDEVHTYHGTLGTDVACLMRRLNDALRKSNPKFDPVFIGTSATLQAGEDTDPKAGDRPVLHPPHRPGDAAGGDHHRGDRDSSVARRVDLAPAPEHHRDGAELLRPGRPKAGRGPCTEVGRSPGPTSTEPPAALWDRAALPYLMMDWLRHPRSEEEVLQLLGERPERQGVDPEALRRELEAALLVGPCLPDGGFVKIRPRVHRFLRGLARFWRCTNPSCGKLLGEGIGECDQCGSKSLPLALCRTCGWDFFVAVQPDENQPLQPWTWRRSTKETLFLYDPPKSRIEVDPEVDASGSEDEDDEPATARPGRRWDRDGRPADPVGPVRPQPRPHKPATLERRGAGPAGYRRSAPTSALAQGPGNPLPGLLQPVWQLPIC